MKRALLGTTAVLGAGFAGLSWAVAPAVADGPIQLTVGGFFREAYMVVLDDDEKGNHFAVGREPGFGHNNEGLFNDAEVHFTGRTVLDNGLEVGARIELEGENDDDQIDEAWVYFAGGFGEVRIGSDDDALENSCIVPPGGTANFSAFSPNQWGANAFNVVDPSGGFPSPFGTVTNSACTGVDNKGDAQKIVYFSPVFYGFQLTASYTPDPNSETHDDVGSGGSHVGMTGKTVSETTGDASFDAAFYLTYFYAGNDWDITLGGGGSFEHDNEDIEDFTDFHHEEQDFYQAAFVLNVDRFSIGGAFEYYNNLSNFDEENAFSDNEFNRDAWVAGGGVAYNYNAWTFGAQYSYRRDIFNKTGTALDFKKTQVQQRAVATVNYVLGPGINLDGEFGYTWRDQDPENTSFLFNNDDYSAMEFGVGTAITF